MLRALRLIAVPGIYLGDIHWRLLGGGALGDVDAGKGCLVEGGLGEVLE
jgi:hypothetical protein